MKYFRPNLSNVFVGQARHILACCASTFQNRKTAIACLVGQELLVVDGDSENHMARNFYRSAPIWRAACICRRVDKRFERINVGFPCRFEFFQLAYPHRRNRVNRVRIFDVVTEDAIPRAAQSFKDIAFADTLFALKCERSLETATGAEYACDGGKQPFSCNFTGEGSIFDAQKLYEDWFSSRLVIPTRQIAEIILHVVEGVLLRIRNDCFANQITWVKFTIIFAQIKCKLGIVAVFKRFFDSVTFAPRRLLQENVGGLKFIVTNQTAKRRVVGEDKVQVRGYRLDCRALAVLIVIPLASVTNCGDDFFVTVGGLRLRLQFGKAGAAISPGIVRVLSVPLAKKFFFRIAAFDCPFMQRCNGHRASFGEGCPFLGATVAVLVGRVIWLRRAPTFPIAEVVAVGF